MKRAEARDFAALEALSDHMVELAMSQEQEEAPPQAEDDVSIEKLLRISNRIFAREREQVRRHFRR